MGTLRSRFDGTEVVLLKMASATTDTVLRLDNAKVPVCDRFTALKPLAWKIG